MREKVYQTVPEYLPENIEEPKRQNYIEAEKYIQECEDELDELRKESKLILHRELPR